MIYYLLLLTPFFIHSCHSGRDYVMSVRFYSMACVYMIGVGSIIFYHAPIFYIWASICGITLLALSTVWSRVLIFHPLLPNWIYLGMLYVAYTSFLSAMVVTWQTIFGKNEKVCIGMIVWILLSFLSPLFLPYTKGDLLQMLLLIQPCISVAVGFPGYDYLRGRFFYEIFPISSEIPPFSYPTMFQVLALYWGGTAIFLCVSMVLKKWMPRHR